MKDPNNKKTIDESSAFASLMKEVEKDRKRAKFFYISGFVLIIIAIFSFLLFGPITVPVFTELGESILNKNESEITEEELETEQQKEDVLVEETKEIKEPEEIEEPIPEKTVTTTPKTIAPKEPTYLCTDQEIQELRDGITTLQGYKSDTEERVNQAYFVCFDNFIEIYPGQTDQWYQNECYDWVCIQNYPDLCAMPDQFQEGIDDFQTDLNNCLSDR